MPQVEKCEKMDTPTVRRGLSILRRRWAQASSDETVTTQDMLWMASPLLENLTEQYPITVGEFIVRYVNSGHPRRK